MVSNAIHSMTSRPLRFTALGLCLLALPAAGRAANNCPWMNEATASGLLDAAAVGSFTVATAGQPAVCTFVAQDTAATHTLRIAVEIAAEPHTRLSALAQVCGADAAPLRAIGNEALVCAADDRKGAMGERVYGRVRNQVFSISIGSTLRNDPSLTRDELKTKIYTAAEQVAGNLF